MSLRSLFVESLNDAERAILLHALFELWITQSAFDDDPARNLIPIVATIPREQIDTLVVKLGGDPDTPMFGSDAGTKPS